MWIDLLDPSNDELKQASEELGVHPLALEDARKRGQRPKLDDFGEYMFLVYYGAGSGEDGREIRLEEVHAFLSGGYIVTSHQRPCAPLEDALDFALDRTVKFTTYFPAAGPPPVPRRPGSAPWRSATAPGRRTIGWGTDGTNAPG